jgi:hypothetical protein
MDNHREKIKIDLINLNILQILKKKLKKDGIILAWKIGIKST